MIHGLHLAIRALGLLVSSSSVFIRLRLFLLFPRLRRFLYHCSSSSSMSRRVQTGSTACTFPYKRLGCSCLRLASSFILDCSCSIVFHQFLCVHRSRRCPDLIYNMHLAIRALGLFLSPSSHVLDCPFRFVVVLQFVIAFQFVPPSLSPWFRPCFCIMNPESSPQPSAPLRSMLPTDQPSPAVSSLLACLPPVCHQICNSHLSVNAHTRSGCPVISWTWI